MRKKYILDGWETGDGENGYPRILDEEQYKAKEGESGRVFYKEMLTGDDVGINETIRGQLRKISRPIGTPTERREMLTSLLKSHWNVEEIAVIMALLSEVIIENCNLNCQQLKPFKL